jgi:hypothetical protein
VIRHDGHEYPGAHEPIISVELWERANAIRSGSARRRGRRWPKGSHLLTGGLLRCGKCGYAMVPRTNLNPTIEAYEVYECFGRKQRGTEFCSQPPIRRHVIDQAILSELTGRYIDLEATRRRIEQRLGTDLLLAQEALTQAEKDAQKAAAAFARVERDYLDGKLTVEQWQRFEAKLISEHAAADAAVQRAQGHVEQVREAGTLADAEEALLRRLADLREAIVDGVERAPDLNALRTIVRQLLASVELVSPEKPFGTGTAPGIIDQHDGPDPCAGEYRLFIRLREEAFDLDQWRPKKPALTLERTEHGSFPR